MSSCGSPVVSSRQVRPPSTDLWIPDSGPPFMSAATVRRRWWVEAYMTSGSVGSRWTSFTPVHSPPPSTFVQVSPPSSLMYSPRWPPPDHRGPCAATYTTFGAPGRIRIMPTCSDSSSPMCSQVCPPSRLR